MIATREKPGRVRSRRRRWARPAGEELRWLARQARAQIWRSMRQFAEEEIVIPEGDFKDRLFRVERQPYTGLWLDAIDSGMWQRAVATGPTQTGKTLLCFVIVLMYHLFEIGETVICGVPHMEMAADKWRIDIEPVIAKSAYRDLIPTRGPGSRGGTVTGISFRNGATLRFMTGGGDDKTVAGYTARVLVITETDGMDESGARSREADRITQLEARLRASPGRARTYMECTVSIPEGRTWREIKAGTDSRIMLPCQLCGSYVQPEREHLVGWQEAADVIAARDNAAFVCPACGEVWSEQQRREANLRALLAHSGQTIEGGRVRGEPRRTDTFGFRWSAVNNLFASAGYVGMDEWKAARAADEDNAQRKMQQFVWAVPWSPPDLDLTRLNDRELTRRTGPVRLVRGLLPDDTAYVTGGMDIGKWLCHYVVTAWRKNASGHVVDYGAIDVPSDDMAIEAALLKALQTLRDIIGSGWASVAGGKPRPADLFLIDAGWQESTDVVYKFCRETHARDGARRLLPSRGYGFGQRRQFYREPRRTGNVVLEMGDNYHVTWLKTQAVHLFEMNADHWKGWVHDRLAMPADMPGALTLFQAAGNEHVRFVKHLTAEEKEMVDRPGQGHVLRWKRVRRENHFLDAIYAAAVAGHYCGARLIEEPAVETVPAEAEAVREERMRREQRRAPVRRKY